MKKLISFAAAAIMVLSVVPGMAEEEYKTRHVYDGYDPVYETTKEKYHTYETEHFQIFWGDSGEAGKVTGDFLANCDRVLENCWDKFVVEMGMTPPTTSNKADGDHTTQYKINVILNETGVEGYGGWAFGGVDREGYPYFMCAPDAMTDWVVPHEMGHVMHFAQGRNAWEGNNYLGPWYEAIGNWFREQYLYDEKCFPGGEAYRTDLSALYLRESSLMAVNGRGYYEAWPLLQYLTDNPDALADYGPNFIAKLLGYHPAPDDGFYNVLAANTVNSVPDTIGYFASHMATLDFKQKTNYNLKVSEMLRYSLLYPQQRYTSAIPWGEEKDVYTVPMERTPQSYGYNIIPLQGAGEISVALNGLVSDAGADWRARIVVEGADGETRYSELFKSGETASITVAEGEELYLTVAATPEVAAATKLGLGGWAGFEEGRFPYESKKQYPYTFTLTNASPADNSLSGAASLRHPNGGGIVSPTATVAQTAYVGPNAMVLGNATVKDNAVIDGNAIVARYATVSDNAYVGGSAIVTDTASVSDNARVLESALVSGGYKVSGNAAIKGQAILMGTGEATGQAIAYGDFYEDENKIITGGAFAGYHSVNTELGYANAVGENTFRRAFFDRLQARYEFDGDFSDSVGYSNLYAVNPPVVDDGRAIFDGGGEYLAVPSSVLSFDNAELELGIEYEAGSVFDFGGLRLGAQDGKPALAVGDESVVLDVPYSAGQNTVGIKIFNGNITLSANGASSSLETDAKLYSMARSGKNYIGRSVDGDSFKGKIDYLRIYLYDGNELTGSGRLPDGVEPVFKASGAKAGLNTLTSDNASAWCGWNADSESVLAGQELTVGGNGLITVDSPIYGRNKFAIEFAPSGDGIYPDHAVIDGGGKYLFAHRFAADADRIYPGRGEQNFCGSGGVTDSAGQKRLAGFIAEAVYTGSAMTARGAADYGEGDLLRIIVENTVWSKELGSVFSEAANKSEANLSSVNEGDPVYTVTYAVISEGFARPVSTSVYKGTADGFAGIKSFGSWADKNVNYGDLTLYADEVPCALTSAKGGVIVTNAAGGSVVFASYDGDSLGKAAQAPVEGEGLTSFIPLPDGFPEEGKAFLLSDLAELRPLTGAARLEKAETMLTSSVGQTAAAFHGIEEKKDKAVYSFEFLDNGSKDGGVLLGDSAMLNASSGNYFASGSIDVLFAGGELFTRDDKSKTKVASYTAGERVAVRIEADVAANTYDLYVNGSLAASSVGFRVGANTINTLALVENGGGKAFNVYNFLVE